LSRAGSATAGASLRPGLVLLGLLLVGANLRASITSVGPVLDELRDELALPSAAASALISLPVLAFAVVSPFAPALARRLGLEPTLALALGTLATGIVLRSLPVTGLIWVGTALLGIAIAVVNVELPALVKRDFPERIGQVTGAYSAVQAVFAAAAAGLAVPIAGSVESGWRLAIGVWAGLAIIALAVFAPQLRRHHVVPAAADDIALEMTTGGAPVGRSPWRSALAWQVTAFMGLQSVCYYSLITWLPTIERAMGIGAAEAGVHQLVFNAAGIIGSIAASALIPRFRDQRLLGGVGAAVIGVALLGILLLPALMVLWALLAGAAGGLCIVLALSMFGLRTANHSQAAALSGMAQAAGYLVAAAGPIAVGVLHDVTGTWQASIVLLVVVDLLLIVAAQFAGRRRVLG